MIEFDEVLTNFRFLTETALREFADAASLFPGRVILDTVLVRFGQDPTLEPFRNIRTSIELNEIVNPERCHSDLTYLRRVRYEERYRSLLIPETRVP